MRFSYPVTFISVYVVLWLEAWSHHSQEGTFLTVFCCWEQGWWCEEEPQTPSRASGRCVRAGSGEAACCEGGQRTQLGLVECAAHIFSMGLVFVNDLTKSFNDLSLLMI